MKNSYSLLAVIFVCLAGYALFAAQGAYQRGERMGAFLLIVIALIFWKRSQKVL